MFAAVCAVCFVLCYLVAGHLYQRGAAAQEENGGTQQKKWISRRPAKEGSPLFGHFPQRNGRACCALPTYVMNGLISVIMAPLMVVMMMIAIPIQEVASEIGMSGASASELLSSLPPQDVMMILMLIVVGFGYFFAAMNICG